MTPETLKALLFRGAGYIFPVISIPVFAALLPSNEYGRLGVALTFCSILQALCEGGHTIAGARRLAAASDDRQRQEVSVQAYAQRWVLLIASAGIAAGYYTIRQLPAADWQVLAICLLGIVLMDMLVPTWIFHGLGSLGTLGQILFFSRAISFPLALLVIWLLPSASGGALATCLPFVVMAIWSRRAASALCPAAAVRLEKTLRRPLFNAEQMSLHLGSMFSTVFPALVMQVWALLEPGRDLGLAYLAIALWIAGRQFAILPNQSVFHLSAASTPRADLERLRHEEWKAQCLGATIMLVAALSTLLFGPTVLDMLKSDAYRMLPSVLWPMLLSGGLFVIAHGILLSHVAAGKGSRDFARTHALACLSFVIACPVFHTLAGPGSMWPLSGAIAAADVTLLGASIVMRHRARFGTGAAR